MIKKSVLNIGIIVYVGILLILGFSHPVSTNLENNSFFSFSSGFKFVYAQNNDLGQGDNRGGNNDSNSNQNPDPNPNTDQTLEEELENREDNDLNSSEPTPDNDPEPTPDNEPNSQGDNDRDGDTRGSDGNNKKVNCQR